MLHTEPSCHVPKQWSLRRQGRAEECCIYFIRQNALTGDVFHPVALTSGSLPEEAGNWVRDQTQGLFVTQILRRIYSLSWGSQCEHRLAHRGKHTLHFLQTRCEVWPSQVWFVSRLFFFSSQGKLTFVGGLRAESLQMNKKRGNERKAPFT